MGNVVTKLRTCSSQEEEEILGATDATQFVHSTEPQNGALFYTHIHGVLKTVILFFYLQNRPMDETILITDTNTKLIIN